MTREFINNTGSPIFISDAGVTLAVGTYPIDPTNWGLWASSVDIDTFLASGDVSLKINGVTLNAYEGAAVLHELTDYVRVKNSGSTVKEKAQEVDFVSPLIATSTGDGKVKVEVGYTPFFANFMVAIQCTPDGCIVNASILVDQTICFIGKGVC